MVIKQWKKKTKHCEKVYRLASTLKKTKTVYCIYR